MPRSSTILTALATLLVAAAGADATTLAGWSQYVAGGSVEARVVTDEPACPPLIADGRARPMTERAAPDKRFSVRVCVAPIPEGVRHLKAGGIALPVPVARPRHIVVFGDSGCRLKGDKIQDCHDDGAWPFRRIAAHAARERPDLMIHVGDYVYRETACPPGDRRCTGTPTGDRWATWNADFFEPAALLLRRTVWLMARGNHEDCARAGTGWTTLLGHDPMDRDPNDARPCHPHETPLLVDLGGVTLALLDDNDAADDVDKVKPAVVQELKRDIDGAMASKADWLVTHHPFRGVSKPDKSGGPGSMEGANATLLEALGGADEAPLTLMLSGHIHNFQIANYRGTHPPQLVVGEGGDALETSVPPRLTGLTTRGGTVTEGLSLPGFGYVVLDRIGRSRDWKITVHAVDGAVLRACALKSRRLTCVRATR